MIVLLCKPRAVAYSQQVGESRTEAYKNCGFPIFSQLWNSVIFKNMRLAYLFMLAIIAFHTLYIYMYMYTYMYI